jgi:lipopolysaccharide biosynthesis glycosyltransferase
MALLLCFCDSARIDPSRLLVATVVDGSNSQIVADSHVFFRSIRLFGGTLNDATLLACIVVEKEQSFVNDELLLQYTELGVEVDFIRQTPSPFPRTLNKFATFYKYDADRYDYFLWLDADIVVFGDPLVRLPDLQAGKIYCVPEVYNYMKRFGLVNNSAIMWNPSLPPFHLVQEDIPVPHGVCNTGMLLFDSISLRIFLQELFKPSHLQYLSGYTDDRFIDSLAFVIAVNSASIFVEPLEYVFNFMAYFELTLFDFGFTEPPLLVHFIHDTSLLFNIRDNGQCYSMYQCSHINNKLEQENSMVSKQVLKYFALDSVGVNNCLIMAKQLAPPFPLTEREKSEVTTSTDNTMEESLVVVWPVSGSRLFVSKDRFDLDIIIEHSTSIFENVSEVTLHLQIHYNEAIIYDGLKSAKGTSCFDNDNKCRSIFTVTTLFDVSTAPSFECYLFASRNAAVPSDEFLPRVLSTGWISCTVVFLGFPMLDKLPRRIGGRNQVMDGPMHVALSSQIDLPLYLNMRNAIDVGVILCCDTVKGVVTTKELIYKWSEEVVLEDFLISFLPRGGVLIISLTSTPFGADDENLNALEQELSETCNSAKGNHLSGCVITRVGDVKKIIKSSVNTLSFVYMDTFVSQDSFGEGLEYWHSSLAIGGVMIGKI